MKIEVKIEKGIPMPNQRMSFVAQVRKMCVGDSFLTDRKRQSSMHQLRLATGFKFATRSVSDRKMRVWRTK